MSNSRASDEGVQNDFLPLLDGTDISVSGKKLKISINTRNILFVSLGAFTKVKPEDLIVEIQGRFPTKVRVNALKAKDFKKILQTSKNNVLNQAKLLMKSENIDLDFTESAIDEICEISQFLNEKEDDVGARRLISVIEKVLEDISFQAPDLYKLHSKNDQILK
jgi:ATP-dependent HslUV protease ATP-binding subunit HslU